MTHHRIVTRDEWLAARQAHLAKDRGRSGASPTSRRDLCGCLSGTTPRDRSFEETHGLALQMGFVIRQ